MPTFEDYEWHGKQWSKTGCPGEYNAPGWYSGDVFVVSSYKNPSTGSPYTPTELEGLGGGGTTTPGTTPSGTTTPTTTPTGGNINPYTGQPFTTADLSGMGVATVKDFWNFYNQGLIQKVGDQYKYVGELGVVGTGGWGENVPTPYNIPSTITPTAPPTPVTMPTFGTGAAAGIPTPEIKPAPPYEPSPELQAWQEEYGTKLTDWVKSGGYGIPEETQAQMIQLQTDTLKAREQENIRVMRNNMERRGITNSGYIDANMHMITSNTTVALAGAIADVQIKSALMKMASFEKAMGAASQFLGYLSEQSQLAYAPEFATWQAEQLATMQAWQGQLDIYKMELNQAYQTQNIREQARLQGILAEQQHGYDIELAEMEIAFQQEAAKAEGAGQLMGSASGLVGSLIAGS